MTTFLILYRSSVSAMEQMANNTPEQAAAGMEAWMAWAHGAGEAIVDLGSPVQVVQAGGDAGDPGAGYSIMQAADADELRTILEGHPHTAFGGTIEILEVLPLPGM